MNEAKYNALLNIFSHSPYTLLSSSHRAFLIADTTLLRKTGSKIEGVKKLYDPYSRKVIPPATGSLNSSCPKRLTLYVL